MRCLNCGKPEAMDGFCYECGNTRIAKIGNEYRRLSVEILKEMDIDQQLADMHLKGELL